jgi:hypothetical protein
MREESSGRDLDGVPSSTADEILSPTWRLGLWVEAARWGVEPRLGLMLDRRNCVWRLGNLGSGYLLGAPLSQAVREIISTGGQNTMLANDFFRHSCRDHGFVCSIHSRQANPLNLEASVSLKMRPVGSGRAEYWAAVFPQS